MKWDAGSILQLTMGGVAIFAQIWSIIHGAPIDSTHTAVGVGLAAGALNHAMGNGKMNGGGR